MEDSKNETINKAPIPPVRIRMQLNPDCQPEDNIWKCTIDNKEGLITSGLIEFDIELNGMIFRLNEKAIDEIIITWKKTLR